MRGHAHQLVRRVLANGQKIVFTGEGADEWLVGYPWYKMSKALGMLDLVPWLHLSDRASCAYLNLNHGPQFPAAMRRRSEALIGGPNTWIDAYGLLGLSKLCFYAETVRKIMEARNPWGDSELNLEWPRRWHPMNRGVWVAGCVTLAALLLQAKGDRVVLNSSVEVCYPFLDEEGFDFLATPLPRWKIGRGETSISDDCWRNAGRHPRSMVAAKHLPGST